MWDLQVGCVGFRVVVDVSWLLLSVRGGWVGGSGFGIGVVGFSFCSFGYQFGEYWWY
jgi:hypothetical protein